VQAVSIGLIGEIIVFLSAPERLPYRIAREVVPAQAPASRDPARPPPVEAGSQP
jgi:hypothetical protein